MLCTHTNLMHLINSSRMQIILCLCLCQHRWLKGVNEFGMCMLRGVPCTKEAGLEVRQYIIIATSEIFIDTSF